VRFGIVRESRIIGSIRSSCLSGFSSIEWSCEFTDMREILVAELAECLMIIK